MSAGPNNLKTKSPHFGRGDRAPSYPSAMDEIGAGACFIARGSGGRYLPYIYSMTKRSLYRRGDVRQSEHFCSESQVGDL